MKKCGKYSKPKKCLIKKNLSSQLPKSAAENRLRLSKQKSSVLETQLLRLAFPSQANPTLPLVPLYLAIKKDAEYARNTPDYNAGPAPG